MSSFNNFLVVIIKYPTGDGVKTEVGVETEDTVGAADDAGKEKKADKQFEVIFPMTKIVVQEMIIIDQEKMLG